MVKRILIILVVLLLGGYLIASVTVLNKTDENAMCSEVSISVLDSAQTGFISSKEITEALKKEDLYPKGKKLIYIDDKRIESVLQNTPFIKTAECYKSASGKICIEVTQQLPVLSIRSNKGESYYVDENGRIMSSRNYTANVIVATGHITHRFAKKTLTPIGNMLIEDEFWNKQIEQINVTPSQEIELIPRVGEHEIFLGKTNAKRMEKQLANLKTLYTKAMGKAGWNKYSRINLEFDNQIICTKRNN